MRRNRPGLVFFIATIIFSSPVMAADVKGSKDNSLLGRFAGSEIRVYKNYEFDEFPYITGAFSGQSKKIDKLQTVEGRLTMIGYHIPNGTSFAQVSRNYRIRLEQQGFKVDFECSTAKGNCGDQIAFSNNIKKPSPLPEPGFYEWDGWNYRFMSAHLSRPQGDVYTSIWITKYSNAEVPVFTYVSVLEQQSMAYKMIDAGKMAKSISETGRIALYGIHFDSDKADIKSESNQTIQEIARLLKQDPKLKLVIVGHTDNQGGLDHNMKLSKRRAMAVRDALVKQHGIVAARLSAWGAGYLAPVASNRSEDGRAKNRRVELVEQ